MVPVNRFLSNVARAANNRLQRAGTDKVPRHVGQRAAAEPERQTAERHT
jgi:hypothetical protein